jgi:hypothetical protein
MCSVCKQWTKAAGHLLSSYLVSSGFCSTRINIGRRLFGWEYISTPTRLRPGSDPRLLRYVHTLQSWQWIMHRSHQPRLIQSFHYAVCRPIYVPVYATKLYIQPLNKKLLDLSSPACMYPPMASSDQELKKSTPPILRRARRTWRYEDNIGHIWDRVLCGSQKKRRITPNTPGCNKLFSPHAYSADTAKMN